MASIDDMIKLGYGPEKNTLETIAGMVNGVDAQTVKQHEKERADITDQGKLYFELRQQGYSEADAHEKVTRTFRSTGFIEKIVNGKAGPQFTKPSQDIVAIDSAKKMLENKKTESEIEENKASAKKSTASAGYYDRGGPSHASNERLSPNQIQARIKDLRNQLGMGSAEDDANLNSEISFLNERFDKISGFRAEPTEAPATTTPGDVKEESVLMTWKDGTKWRIPKSKVAAAKTRGFK